MDLYQRLSLLLLRGPTRLVILLFALILTAAPISQAQPESKANSNFNYGPSPTTAVRYSLFGTLLPITTGALIFALDRPDRSFNRFESDPDRTLPALLIWGGVTLGPSMGYFYGNKTGRGLGGFALRNGVVIGGTLAALAICPPFSCSEDSEDLAGLVLLGSMGIVLGSSIYDIANVRKSVKKENAKRATKSLSVRPMLSNGFRPSGIALTLRF